MLYKFKNNNKINDRSPILESALLHFTFAIFILWIIFYKPTKDSVSIDIVYESPTQSQSAKSVPEIKKTPEKKNDLAKTKGVYGVSKKSVTSETGLDSKQGNTVAKTPDDKILKTSDPESLPIPADEFLVTRMPRLKTEVRIPYPEEAKKNRIQGAVVMDLLIDALGKVREINLISGPDRSLNDAAISAVRNFEFEPAEIQNKSVAVRIRYAYRFVLD